MGGFVRIEEAKKREAMPAYGYIVVKNPLVGSTEKQLIAEVRIREGSSRTKAMGSPTAARALFIGATYYTVERDGEDIIPGKRLPDASQKDLRYFFSNEFRDASAASFQEHILRWLPSRIDVHIAKEGLHIRKGGQEKTEEPKKKAAMLVPEKIEKDEATGLYMSPWMKEAFAEVIPKKAGKKTTHA